MSNINEKNVEYGVKIQAVSETSSIVESWTPEEERAVVRKIDWRLYPMLCIIFGFNLVDRNNISLAYIAGMSPDLQLNVGARYNIALLVFFIPYFFFEIPSNLIIRRLGARFWLSGLITAWGACILGMGFVTNYQGLTALRTLLGLFEAGLLPGSVFIIASWYKPYETATRTTSFWMIAQTMAAFGHIIAYVLSLISVGDGLFRRGWRWIFIVEGLATILAGLVAPFFLIDFPERAKFLTPREKEIAVERVKGVAKVHPSLKESMGQLKDWKLIVFCTQYMIAASSIYSLASFAPIILNQGLGFPYAKSCLLSTPPYLCAIILAIAAARVSDKIRLRWPIICGQALIGITGLLVMLYAVLPAARYFGLFLATYGIQANLPSLLAYVPNQTAMERRGVVTAVVISAGAIGGIIGTTIFRSQDAPHYYPGMWATVGMNFVQVGLTFGMSMYLRRMNRLADEGKVVLENTVGFRYAP